MTHRKDRFESSQAVLFGAGPWKRRAEEAKSSGGYLINQAQRVTQANQCLQGCYRKDTQKNVFGDISSPVVFDKTTIVEEKRGGPDTGKENFD